MGGVDLRKGKWKKRNKWKDFPQKSNPRVREEGHHFPLLFFPSTNAYLTIVPRICLSPPHPPPLARPHPTPSSNDRFALLPLKYCVVLIYNLSKLKNLSGAHLVFFLNLPVVRPTTVPGTDSLADYRRLGLVNRLFSIFFQRIRGFRTDFYNIVILKLFMG